MRVPPAWRIAAALLCACAPLAAAAASSACAATMVRPMGDARISQAIAEARRQHQLFGGQTIERNGGMFGVGYYEAEWDHPAGESVPTWERVATFWRALPQAQQPRLMTSAGWLTPADALPVATGNDAVDAGIRESLLRAAIVDTPWSAAFISYLMKTAGFSREEFAFSDTHADYVQAAFAASAAEDPAYAFRACDVRSTRPRAGDLLCATRADTAGIRKFEALRAALAERAPGQDFPMHCELVVRADAGGDAKLDAIGGNVVQSVTMTRMTLNADKLLGEAYFPADTPHPAHLGRRSWVVLLQFRH
jgi:hypothetical protein